MSRLAYTRRAVVWTFLALTSLGVTTGTTCPAGGGPGTQPVVPPGNRPPRITITSITTPSGNNIAQQGELVLITFTGEDGEDTAIARVFASLSPNPTPAEEIPILSGFAVGPGEANGLAIWDTGEVSGGLYNIFAEIDDRTFDPFTGTGNPAVRVTSATGVIIVPPGTLPTNGAPTIVPKLPSIDIGLTHEDLLVVRFDITDPESDLDTLTVRILLDQDRIPTNDASQPPIQIDTFQLTPGFTPPNVLFEVTRSIVINLNQIPIRRETDAQGRPLPYFVRIQANDGEGNIVNAYTLGSVRLLASASGVVDLLGVGGRISGATFQGFGGHPTDPTRGDRVGNAFARLGDLDGDGIDDFAIVAETASPFGVQGAGHVYAIYGRERAIDPDLPNASFFQGRFSGILNLNTVGTWVDFPPNDPRFRNFFKIRGQSMPHSHEGGGNSPGTPSLGITSVAAFPDVTGDGRPEILVGAPFTSDVVDEEDIDPCDLCRSGTFACLDDPEIRIGESSLNGTVTGIGEIPSNTWAPANPENLPSFGVNPNVNLDLGTSERIIELLELRFRFNGNLTNPPPMVPVPVQIEVQLESECGPRVIFNGNTEIGGAFDGATFVARFNWATGMPPPARPSEFPVAQKQSFPPSIYDGVFTVFVRPNIALAFTSIEVEMDCIVAPLTTHQYLGTYADGLPKPISDNEGCSGEGVNPFLLNLLVRSGVYPGAQGPICAPFNLAINFFDSLQIGSRVGLFSGVYNQILDGHFCNLLDNIPGFFTNVVGFTNDRTLGLYQSGLLYVAMSDELLTTIDLDPETPDNLRGTWTGDGCPVQPLGQFGQAYGGCLNDAIRGGRFRGSWYNPDGIGGGLGGPFVGPYDPTSLFGYTIDAMPDINTIFSDHELLISAPGGGVAESFLVDLSSDLGGDYFSSVPTKKTVTFDMGTRFSRVHAAGLRITGKGLNLPRMRLSITDPMGNPLPGADTTLLLWEGPNIVPPNLLTFRKFFGPRADPMVPGVCSDYEFNFSNRLLRFAVFPESDFAIGFIDLPSGFDAGEHLATGIVTLSLEILDDCTITNSSAEITSAEFYITGLVPGWGYVWILEGQDYTDDGSISESCNSATITTNGDGQTGAARPMSWPSTGCNQTVQPPPVRDYCYPQPLAYMVGEERGDAFGWARHAGDINGDGVADIICGAPLSSNDPFVPDTANCPCTPFSRVPFYPCSPFNDPNRLQNNGKVYLIYGEAVLQDGPPCRYERFEIRGSHDGDQFGRVQGRAGDVNGDGIGDVYFAAENYDAIGSIGGVQNRGVEAGFVGVLFGNFSLTGEIAVNAEQVGTGNFKGVKFIGGAPGVRLGGGLTSRTNPLLYPVGGGTPDLRFEALPPIIEYTQHGVSSAGDFNLDGFDDLLMTAPGQEWPAAKIEFIGPVADGTRVTINGRTFEFEISGGVAPGNTPVFLTSTNPIAAQAAFFNVLEPAATDENLNITALTSRLDFPDPLPDTPTVTFLARRTSSTTVWTVTSSNPTSVLVTMVPRQGVAYLIFGGPNLENKTFYLPDDLNRRVSGQRILKGIAFVSAYEKGTIDEAPIEAALGIGDVDGDGFPDIILGAPTADFINVLAPSQRRQSVGEAYLIYGNSFGLNNVNSP